MKIADYPAQEPFTVIGARYHEEVLRRGADIMAQEFSYGADPYQGVLVFAPGHPTGEVVVLLHGGGWTNGYKEWMSFMAPALNTSGIIAVSLGYRLAPAHLFPAGFADCQDGIAWVYRHIARFGGDARRIFLCGHSAGGHYAALLALRDDWLAPRGLPPDIVAGALPISGSYYFGAASGLSQRPRFLGPEGSSTEHDAAPLHFVRPGAPPFHLSHGDADFPHLVRQAEEFEQALRAARVPVQRLVLPACDHLGASYDSGDVAGTWIAHAVPWIRDISEKHRGL